jgi:CRP-like cAMP-binding protein
MSSFSKSSVLIGNRILAALPRQEYQRLFANLELVQLARNKVLYNFGDHIQHAYFPNSGMISLLSITENGSTTEVSMVSNEGVVGIPIILGVNTSPYLVKAQISGNALRVRAELLKSEFNRGGPLHEFILRYTYTLIGQISQSAACNRFHTLEERLCRWLLISQDRVKSDTLTLTQEILSHMVGASRTNVTEAAYALKRAGLISYTRGNVHILNRQALESSACECYNVVKREILNSLAA